VRPKGNQQDLAKRRLKAVRQVVRGERTQAEVAKQFAVSRQSVSRWVQEFKSRGAKGLRATKNTGRPSRLSPAQSARLEKMLLQGARASGFPSDLWTCPRIAQVIERRFSVKYHVDHVCRLLRELGWSVQKPERRAIERNEREIRRWVRVEWPRIKKKPAV